MGNTALKRDAGSLPGTQNFTAALLWPTSCYTPLHERRGPQGKEAVSTPNLYHHSRPFLRYRESWNPMTKRPCLDLFPTASPEGWRYSTAHSRPKDGRLVRECGWTLDVRVGYPHKYVWSSSWCGTETELGGEGGWSPHATTFQHGIPESENSKFKLGHLSHLEGCICQSRRMKHTLIVW